MLENLEFFGIKENQKPEKKITENRKTQRKRKKKNETKQKTRRMIITRKIKQKHTKMRKN